MTKPNLTTDELKVYREFVELFNYSTMATNMEDTKLQVVASLGVGVYRQGRREEREEILSEIDSRQSVNEREDEWMRGYYQALADLRMLIEKRGRYDQ